MSSEPEKGVAGEKTGAEAREAISKAKDRSATNESIGVATDRDPSTIQQIESGSIKNPPADLAENVSKAKSVKDEKSKTEK